MLITIPPSETKPLLDNQFGNRIFVTQPMINTTKNKMNNLSCATITLDGDMGYT
jgi:hypothetical protein